MKQNCQPAVSFRVSSVWPEDLCRVPGFYSSALDFKTFCMFFLAAGYIALLKLFSQPIHPSLA